MLPTVAIVALCVGAGFGPSLLGGYKTAAQASTTSTRCVGLAAGGIPQAKLEASYRKLTLLGANTPVIAGQPRRYGECGATHYAFERLTVSPKAKLTQPQRLAQQSHALLWHQTPTGAWVDLPLASMCKLASKSLIKIWSVGVTC